jgi:hypothetical protein
MRNLLNLCFFLVFSGSAAAEGTYARVELGRSELDLSGFDESNTEAFGITIGQQIVDNLSAELGYRKLEEFRLDRLSGAALSAGLIQPGNSSPERLDISLFEVGAGAESEAVPGGQGRFGTI